MSAENSKIRKEAFSKLGELAVYCAKLEHRLRGILILLFDKDSLMIGPFIIDDLNLYSLIQKIRKAAKYRAQDNKPLLSRITNHLDKIDEIRKERNLLIHGDWQIENIEHCGLKVWDYEIKYKDGYWQHLQQRNFTDTDLNRLISKCKNMVKEAEVVREEIESFYNKLAPNRNE